MTQKNSETNVVDFGYAGTAARVIEVGAMCYGLAEADNGQIWIAAVGGLALGATVISELVVEVVQSKRQKSQSSPMSN